MTGSRPASRGTGAAPTRTVFQGNGTNTPNNGARFFADAGSLSLSLGYRFNKYLSFHFDGNNLNNEIRYTYHINEQAPAGLLRERPAVLPDDAG
jgi:hypothetical protein